QRGFQHLWTFYQDNVCAVKRENERGRVVAWDDLPVPPPPTATAIRTNTVAVRRAAPPDNAVAPAAAAAAAPATRASQPTAERSMQRRVDYSTVGSSSPPQQQITAEQPRRFARVRESSALHAADATPPRPTTQRVPIALAPPPRRDEVMEPLCPVKPPSAVAPPPPPGLCNWLFQVGLDCMVTWEEGTLSR
ncbi:hypothetical protein LPJ73_000484, partial [Coemansia sp. RSA 2703]